MWVYQYKGSDEKDHIKCFVNAQDINKNFVDDIPWAHIDIAGTAFDVPNISYYRPGGTGVGVRLLVALAMNWK